ncbi:IclR family transcriptional regulator [Halomarina halobia]|uniref:IclR family transcriptional regulator n=1 Tax=Halomarina halobia TaxID=3033386 RepID=A0ABD6ADN5_9EURY|nr:IclR family transcriptional regulator [Halomarina sp. PSR21]
MVSPGSNGRSLKTIERSFEIVEHLMERDGARVSELASHLGLPKSTVHSYLTTLHGIGYLIKEGDEYHVGLRFLDVGGYAANRKRAYRMAGPKVKELAEETKERAQFIVEESGYGIYLHHEIGSQAVRTDVRVGKRTHLHTISAGKAILAYLPEHEVRRIIDERGLIRKTAHTITDEETLFDDLERVREQGYALNREERIDGQCAIGAPVRIDDRVIGAFSVSGPTHRMKGERLEREIADLLLGTANELELNMAYS